uniref:Uncharacterized protein n=1 Tax=Mola mola TaxID=94237 RepID=A0A3Q3X5L5_MOLML
LHSFIRRCTCPSISHNAICFYCIEEHHQGHDVEFIRHNRSVLLNKILI